MKHWIIIKKIFKYQQEKKEEILNEIQKVKTSTIVQEFNPEYFKDYNEDNKKVTLQEFEKIMKNYLGKILYQHFYRK